MVCESTTNFCGVWAEEQGRLPPGSLEGYSRGRLEGRAGLD